MADNKITLPQSGGGLMRFSEGSAGSKLTFGPWIVVGVIIVVILIEIIFHRLNFLGL